MKRTMKPASFLLGLFFPWFLLAQNDAFLQEKYRHLHDSPLQEKFRHLAPIPVGAVYVQQPGEGEAQIRQHFRNMKKLGFNCLKQIMTIPGWSIEQVQLLALEEGIIPWWYGEGGWEDINEALLQKLGIPANTPIALVRNDPKMLAYQAQVLRERILTAQAYREKKGKALQDRSVAYEPELGGRGFDLSERGQVLFVEWLKKKYGNIEQVNKVWNQAHAGLQPGEQDPFKSWEDLALRHSKMGGRDYRRLHDILLFKVEHSLENIRKTCEAYQSVAPSGAFRGGGEIGLFHPLAWYGVDLERIADLMQEYGSFYSSIHYAWHFGETDYELVRPFYMQASLANDFFKGGWAATWESTGGPQQFSGGRGGGAYFTVDAGTLTQFLFSQIAAGFKGWGAWTWSTRSAGWEAGEYGLLDRNNQISERAIRMGQIGQTANRFRDELWQAQKEPLVGVLYDWDSEAFWAAMTEAGRAEFKDAGIQARIGVSRALINANVPFEYVTATDLRQGLAARYKVIYLPAIVSLNSDLLSILQQYVKAGGRLVMDAPTGYFDEQGALLSTIKGSAFESLFGLEIRDYQGAGTNRDYFLNGQKMVGFVLDLGLTTAQSLARFNDGKVAVAENKVGKGSTLVLGYEASKACFKPGRKLAESNLLRYALGNLSKPYTCTGAIAYRLSSPQADHYFLINDGPNTQANLQFGTYQYRSINDAISGQVLKPGQPIALEAHSGRWIRCEKNARR